MSNKSSFYNKPWFWILIAAIIYLGLFILLYFQDGFSTFTIFTLVSAVLFLLFMGIAYYLRDQAKNFEKFADLQLDEAFSRLDAQAELLGASGSIAESQMRTLDKTRAPVISGVKAGFKQAARKTNEGNYAPTAYLAKKSRNL